MSNNVLASFRMPPITSFEAYRNYVYSIPSLTEEDEHNLFLEFKNKNSLKAAQQLVVSQLKTVLQIASKFKGYGLPQEDLVQEGNIGLMKAVKNFNLIHKVRLYTYAMVWIKSEIQSYILKNWKIVKIATTKNLKKLFFNFKQVQKDLIDLGIPKQELIQQMSLKLGVSEEDAREMQSYFSSGDISIYTSSDDGDEDTILELPHYNTPEKEYETKHDNSFYNEKIHEGFKLLNEKQQRVLHLRYYTEDKKTHKEIASELNISSERVRQIENEALEKLKKHLIRKS